MGQRTASERSATAQQRKALSAYVAAGGEESVQRVITAIYAVTRKLDQWYARQLADLDVSPGEWTVLTHLAKSGDTQVTPSQLADAANVAASSMTHRLDRMEERDLIRREPDTDNRTRVLVSLTRAGWEMFAAAVREANVVESDILADLDAGHRTQLAELLEEVIAKLDDLDPS